jgi:YVTN family beta-propeller protein
VTVPDPSDPSIPAGASIPAGHGRARPFRVLLLLAGCLACCVLAVSCTSDSDRSTAAPRTSARPRPTAPTTTSTPTTTAAPPNPIPGMPADPDPANVYAATTAGQMSPAVAGAKPLVYVPDDGDGQVWVIDQATYAVVGKYRVGKVIQHVVPSYDLRTLYANANGSNQLVPFDPATGRPGRPINVDAPYNLYFTPDGREAVVMAERHNRIDFYDPATWHRLHSTDVPCSGRDSRRYGGVNHADWSADGRYFIATCEFAGRLIKVDTLTGAVIGTLDLGPMSQPQDCRVTPDGKTFFVADMMDGGVHVIDGPTFTATGFIPTGDGAHGIYPSRDTRLAYVSNRGHTSMHRPGGGTISVIDFATRQVVATWVIPGGGSPDMGGVSADGTKLWLSGRYDNVVYVFDTTSGQLVRKIPVGREPHGLAVFPQPGRYSLGHTGNYR